MGDNRNAVIFSIAEVGSVLYITAMVKPIDIGLIQARRKKIEEAMSAERMRHANALTKLNSELEELIVAERVFSRLTRDDEPAGDADADTDQGPSAGKPEGLPSVSEMIKEALTHAVTLGSPGLKPSGILSYIRGKYWPGASTSDVGPIAWRMWQNEQLGKYDSGEYALTDEEEEKVRAQMKSKAVPGEFDLTGKLNP